MMARSCSAVIVLSALFCGCGPEVESLGRIAAGLNVPRALSDELASVSVYVFQCHQTTYRPTKEELLTVDANGKYDNYLSYKAHKSVTIAFQASQEAQIDGIPDRGVVWRFYARGYDSSPLLIAHGATAGPVRIVSDGGTPTEVVIDLERIPATR